MSRAEKQSIKLMYVVRQSQMDQTEDSSSHEPERISKTQNYRHIKRSYV